MRISQLLHEEIKNPVPAAGQTTVWDGNEWQLTRIGNNQLGWFWKVIGGRKRPYGNEQFFRYDEPIFNTARYLPKKSQTIKPEPTKTNQERVLSIPDSVVDADTAWDYLRDTNYKPSEALEFYIKNDPRHAALYALNVLGKRFYAAEPTIAKDPFYAAKYARQFNLFYDQIKQQFTTARLEAHSFIRMSVLEHTVYHGSPHKVDKFDSSKIGTGEGVQAYGWGLYFTDSKQIASWYKTKLSSGGFNRQSFYIDDIFVGGDSWKDDNIVNKLPCSREALLCVFNSFPNDNKYRSQNNIKLFCISTLENQLKEKLISPSRYSFSENDFRDAINLFKTNRVSGNTGHMYEVDLPEYDYLLWDEFFEDQTPSVRNLLRAVDLDNYSQTGRDIYLELSKLKKSDKNASLYLHSIGINGIKYLAAPSRNNNSSKSLLYNYVIFDDKAIEILTKNFIREAHAANKKF